MAREPIQAHESPAMKSMAPKTMVSSMSWPKSGWIASTETTMPKSTTPIAMPGTPGVRCDSAKSQATRTMKEGFTNSEGCTPKGPI